MSKQFLQKPRYEYYKGTTEVIDNELDNFVEDVVDRLNEQYFNKRDLLKVKQNQDEQIADLQYKLKVSEIATKLACERVKYFEEMQDREMGFEDFFGYESNYDLQGIIEQYKEQAEKEVKGE